jgi:hypothetical protein
VQWTRVGRIAAAEPLDRLLHADLLAATGRHKDALRWYATLGFGAPQELPLVGFAALGMARTSERMGDTSEAARHYRRVADLWRNADPALQAAAATAGQRVTALDAGAR